MGDPPLPLGRGRPSVDATRRAGDPPRQTDKRISDKGRHSARGIFVVDKYLRIGSWRATRVRPWEGVTSPLRRAAADMQARGDALYILVCLRNCFPASVHCL